MHKNLCSSLECVIGMPSLRRSACCCYEGLLRFSSSRVAPTAIIYAQRGPAMEPKVFAENGYKRAGKESPFTVRHGRKSSSKCQPSTIRKTRKVKERRHYCPSATVVEANHEDHLYKVREKAKKHSVSKSNL